VTAWRDTPGWLLSPPSFVFCRHCRFLLGGCPGCGCGGLHGVIGKAREGNIWHKVVHAPTAINACSSSNQRTQKQDHKFVLFGCQTIFCSLIDQCCVRWAAGHFKCGPIRVRSPFLLLLSRRRIRAEQLQSHYLLTTSGNCKCFENVQHVFHQTMICSREQHC